MKNPTLIALAGLLLASLAHAEKPNVVFIMADDVGLGDIGHYHRQRTGKEPLAPTPNLDALAMSGMRFSDAHSSTALCSPTRYCAMTGNLCHRSYTPWGVWSSFRKTPITDRDATLARVADRAGLTTAFLGKWHLGGDFRKQGSDEIYRIPDKNVDPEAVDMTRLVGSGPQSAGFDYTYTLLSGIQGPIYLAYENGEWAPYAEDSQLVFLSKENAGHPSYVSDKGPGTGDTNWNPAEVGPRLSAKAVDFIERTAAEDKPFLLCYWTPMVHVPHVPPEEFDGLKIRGATPTHHLDMVLDLDQQVGRIVAALKEAGEYENTLFVFSSDNGGLLDKRGQKAGHDSSGGYRGSKNKPHEGGHRVPFFASWPGRIAAGAESDEPIAVHDLVATLAGLFDLTLGEEQAKDSLDLTKLLLGQEGFVGRDEFLLQGGSGKEVIYRKGDWKLIIQGNHRVTKWEPRELYNLAESPLEEATANKIDDPEHADRVQEMFERYLEIRESGARTTPLRG
ncbi:Choline-sulfatase [Planctomycetes bacterium MalM25]|nr:Choline-sulfatase [Planctomycetes bacterium MalM25]